MPIAIAIGVAGVAAAGASIVSSNKASSTAKKIAAQNNQVAAGVRADNTALLDPYVQAGNKATSSIHALLGIGGDAAAQNAAFQNFRDSSGYKFQFDEGQKAVESGLGKRGFLESGAAKKALTQYGQNVANGSFGGYMSDLERQQAVGLTGASATAGVSQNYGNSVQANNTNYGNIAANAALSNGAAINSAINTGLSAFSMSQGLSSSYGGQGGLTPYGANGLY